MEAMTAGESGSPAPWQAGTFQIAALGAPPAEAWGYIYAGMALECWHGGPPTMWHLFHLGSGGVLLEMTGSVAS